MCVCVCHGMELDVYSICKYIAVTFAAPCRVDNMFHERLKQYLNADVSKDVESVADAAPLPCLRDMFSGEFEVLHK